MASQVTYSSITVSNSVELVYDKTCILTIYDSKNRSDSAEISVQLFDAKKPSDVTLGTTVPKFNFAIPTGGGLFFDKNRTEGPVFDKGVCIAVTATPRGLDAPDASPTVNLMLLRNT